MEPFLMNKTSFNSIDVLSLLIGEPDLSHGAPRPLPGHVEDRLASMGDGAAAVRRRRFSRRREG
jgi:hypothetical protein